MKSSTMKLTTFLADMVAKVRQRGVISMRRVCVAVPMALALAGCASNPSTTATTDWKARAEARSALYWSHIVASKFDEAYALLTPSSRQAIAQGGFSTQMQGLRVVSAKVDKAKCSENHICTVDLKMEVQIRVARVGLRTVPLDHQEVWTLSNDEMYLIRK
jgi:outer membrane PBP1 activator LpoA protein